MTPPIKLSSHSIFAISRMTHSHYDFLIGCCYGLVHVKLDFKYQLFERNCFLPKTSIRSIAPLPENTPDTYLLASDQLGLFAFNTNSNSFLYTLDLPSPLVTKIIGPFNYNLSTFSDLYLIRTKQSLYLMDLSDR